MSIESSITYFFNPRAYTQPNTQTVVQVHSGQTQRARVI